MLNMEADTRWLASAWLLLLLLCHLVISAPTEQQGSAPEWKKFFVFQRTTIVNDNTKIFCKVKGTPQPFIEWFKNGEALADGNRVRITKYALEVKNTQLSDAGEYACRASNQHGVLWGNITLRVLKEIEDATPPFDYDDNDDSDPFSSVLSEPVWTRRKGPASYISGSANKTVELDCDVRGFPEPNITWYKVDGEKRALIDLTKSKYVENNRWKLKIDDLALEDKGQYMCIVANIVGAINWTFTVDVLQRLPVAPIVEEIDNKTAIEGDTVRFTCKIILSYSQPFLQWFQHYKINDSYVDEKGTPNVKLLQQSDYMRTIDDPQNLVLHNVSRQDEGWYTCLVTNTIGMNYKSAYLTVMTDINECSPNPCQNGATCTDGINAYTCGCVAGWNGKNCDQNINECAPIPCKNGATCVDGINAYTCNCVVGWNGKICDQNINECSPNPCLNGATCTDGINVYTCSCVAGLHGKNCEQNINECSPNPCQNGATCTDGINAYTCGCVAGWNGKNCDQNGRNILSNTPVAPAVGSVQSTEQSSECLNKVKKADKFSTQSEELQYWQIEYFKGKVEMQEREKQLLDIKIRMLLADEKRREHKNVDDFINGTYFET